MASAIATVGATLFAASRLS